VVPGQAVSHHGFPHGVQAVLGAELTFLEVAASAARSWAAGFGPVLELGLD
jgi:hypothetical protein